MGLGPVPITTGEATVFVATAGFPGLSPELPDSGETSVPRDAIEPRLPGEITSVCAFDERLKSVAGFSGRSRLPPEKFDAPDKDITLMAMAITSAFSVSVGGTGNAKRACL